MTQPTRSISRPSALNDRADTLHLHYSRFGPKLMLVLSAAWLGMAAFAGVGMAAVLGPRFAALTGGAMALLALVPIWRSLRRLQQREPIVSISRFGIHDRRLTQRLIPWQDISGMRLGTFESSTALLIEFQDLGVAQRHLGASGVVTSVLSLTQRRRAHVGVTLGPLQCRNADVLALCVGHLQRVHADPAADAAAPAAQA
jgi:hypothetical protein